MEAFYVIKFYLFCEWTDIPPTYRLYVDDELMTERTYIWHNEHEVLQERVPITLDKDHVTVKIEQVGLKCGKFSVKHPDIEPNDLTVNFDIT